MTRLFERDHLVADNWEHIQKWRGLKRRRHKNFKNKFSFATHLLKFINVLQSMIKIKIVKILNVNNNKYLHINIYVNRNIS